MKITRIEWCGYRIPFKSHYVTSNGRAEYRYGLLLRLQTDDGITGVGEASPVGAGDEQEVAQIHQEMLSLSPVLLNARIDGEPALHSISSSLSSASAPVRFSIESALYDLLGKAQRRTVVAILGGTPRPVAVNALIATDSPKQAARYAQEAVAAGFTTLKIKVGAPRLEDDIRLLAAVRQEAGPQITIRIDANQAWNVKQAIKAITTLERFGLEYVEQPVLARYIRGLAEVRVAVSTPIAADEALSSTSDAQRLIQSQAADIFIIKAARIGLLEALEILALARKAGKAVIVTSSLEAGVGIAASLHLAALLPETSPACGLATGPLLESDLLIDHLVLSHGLLLFPNGHGLGVVLDEEALRRYSIGITGSVSA
ncbi:MAG: mandelate racemase/muconate lactonizing enzyme family protein [Chloroflexi bacterium]|nr:mandelate racemase/muconate lactonizing enzyme family protein [Chloroflexota bacterium]